jgi:DnaJ family protein C protein 13
MREINRERMVPLQGGGGWPSWNYSEFGVAYPSTNSQLCIGGVYVRLLLEGGDPSVLRWCWH